MGTTEHTVYTVAAVAADLAAAGIVGAVDDNTDGDVLVMNGPGRPVVTAGARIAAGSHWHHPYALADIHDGGVTVYHANHWHEYTRADYPSGPAFAAAVAARIGALMEEHGGL